MRKEKLKIEKTLLYPVDTAKLHITNPAALATEKIEPIDCAVPGNIELDLAAYRNIDLFFGTNILQLQQYELYDFWYEIEFVAPDDNFEALLFEGVDTLAEYFWNGEKIGESQNMFIPYELNVKGRLRAGANRLFVRIVNPVRFAERQEYDAGLWSISAYNYQSVYLRKAPHEFGWDICPRAILGGIFKDIYLVRYAETEIESVYLHTLSIDHNGAHCKAVFDLKIDASLYRRAQLEIEGVCGQQNFFVSERVAFKHGVLQWDIDPDHLALWAPLHYGQPNLYAVRVAVTLAGKILAEKNLSFGVRTAEVLFDRTGVRKEFAVRVNGVPVLCKGTNWVPLDAFHSRDRARLPQALEMLRETECNIVRCWGGNVYEGEEFFDFCDRNGILVWQDFAMACSVYPQTEEFLKNLQEEIFVTVRRIRTHPSLLCYCGDNENDLGMFFNGIDATQYRLTRELIPSVLFRVDPYRAFIPSSPYFTRKVLESRNEQDLSENHLWGPRNYYKSAFYLENKNIFISEIGYHGCPSVESIRKFIPEQSLWPWENDDWMVHQTISDGEWSPQWNRIKLMAYQVRELFGRLPANPQEFSKLSQISQAEALKFFIEFTRYNKWEKTGIIWWNLIDCWPQFSDAVVDYYGDKKLAYYYMKNVQTDLCFLVKEAEGWTCKAVVCNDGANDYTGAYRILNGLTKEEIARGAFRSAANENKIVCELESSKNITAYYILLLETSEGRRYANHFVNGGALNEGEYLRFLKNYAEFTMIDHRFFTAEK